MKLEIFKVGKHTSSSGVSKDYTLDDLNAIILNHKEPTPIVVGHPKTNSPAFGWIKSLFIKGESLFAEASDLVPEFLDLIKQKIYKNRSVSLSQNEDGTLSLNHVGFLGGVLPAVKGLEDIAFNEDDETQILHEFALAVELNEEEEAKKPTAEKLKSKKQKKTKDEDKEPNASVAELSRSISLEQFNSLKSDVAKIVEFMDGFQNDDTNPNAATLQAKIDELNVKIDLAYFQKNMTEKLQLNTLTPAIKNKLLSLLGYFQSLEFSQDEQTKIVSDFQELADLIQPFQTDEVLKKIDFANKKKETNEFTEMNVDNDSLQLFNDATQLSEEEAIPFTEALNILINKNNEV